MKFKDFLKEAVVKPDKDQINTIVNLIDTNIKELIEKFKKVKQGKTFYTDELEIPFDQLTNKNLGEYLVKIHIDIKGNRGNYSDYIANASGSQAGVIFYLKYSILGIIKDMIQGWKPNETERRYKNFLIDVRTVLEHELIHKEQFTKNPLGGFDITNLVKKYGNTDWYFRDKDEIMAHANTMYRQLINLGYDKNTILNMIQQPKEYMETLLKSSSFKQFHNELYKEPKLWKRFLKQLYLYIDGE